MKKFILFILCSLSVSVFANAQTTKKTEKVKIYGNCEMCKATIEKALTKKDGVIAKDWNKDTKILTVTFDSSKLNLNQILQKVADVGYDSDAFKAKDETYNKLPKCCHYDRPKK